MEDGFFKKMLDNLPADIAILDKHYRYVYINKCAMPNDERRDWIIGKTDWEYCQYRGIDTQIAEGRSKLHQDAIQAKAAISLEEEMVVDGKKSYNVRIMQPVFDNAGEMQYLLGYGLKLSDIREKYEVVNKNLRLINSLNELLKRQVEKDDLDIAFTRILDDVIKLTDSKFGFIAEAFYDENGQPYIRTKAVSNISWNAETQRLYEEGQRQGMVFKNLDSIFGQVLKTKQAYISNNPAEDNNASGTPDGHPKLVSFLGVPFMQGNDLIGMVGLANKVGGYSKYDIEYLSPLSQTLSIILKSLKVQSENRSMLGLIKSKEEETLALIHNLKDIVLKMDEDSNIIDISREFEAVTGVKVEQIIGTGFTSLIKNIEDVANYEQNINKLKKNYGGNFMGIYRLNINNIEKYFDLKFSLISLGGIRHILGRMTDITGQIEAQNKMNEMAMVTENTQSTVIIADEFGIIKWVNKAFTNLLGYTLDEVLGRNPLDFLQYEKDRLEDMSNAAFDAVVNKKSFAGEIINRTKDGRKIWVYVNFVFFKDKDNKDCIISVASDITKLKIAEEEIVKALNNEISSNKLKSRFVSLVSHEFRTPLATIQSSIELFQLQAEQLDKRLAAQFEETHNTVLAEIAKLTELMNTFLLKEKISQTTLEPNKILVDLKNFYSELVSNINKSYNNKRIIFNAPNVMKSGMVDVTMMLIVLQNIISNAFKYSDKSDKSPEIDIEFGDDNYEICVRDYGIGIPDKDLPNVFNAFYRADNAENIAGTGIGLNIVKEYVSALGGKIIITSKYAEGTNVKISLPY